MVEGFALEPWIALVLGLALAFFGRALVVFQIGLFGALLGALAALALVGPLQQTGLAPPGLAPELLRLGALLVGALVGWLLAGLVRRVAVFVLGALVGAGALTRLVPPETLAPTLAWLVGAVLGGLLLLFLESPLLKLITAALGGLVVASATSALLPTLDSGLLLLVGIAVAVLGAAAQLARR